MRDAAASGKG